MKGPSCWEDFDSEPVLLCDLNLSGRIFMYCDKSLSFRVKGVQLKGN